MRIKDEKGYVVVEATIIFPVVLLCVTAMLLISVYLMEKACLQTSAEIALTYYKNQMTDTYVGAAPLTSTDGVRTGATLSEYNTANVFRVFTVPTGSKEKGRFEEIWRSIYNDNTAVVDEFKISGVLFYKYIDVTITDEIKMPINLNLIGINNNRIKHTIKLRTTVNDPDQFIRDFDIAKEFVLFFAEKGGLTKKIEELTSKFTSFYNKYLSADANPWEDEK